MPYRRTGRPTGRPPYPGPLTPAEERVLELLREDLTDAEIAERLGLSRDTVHTHVNHMLAKLDLHDRRDLAAWQPEPEAAPKRAPIAVVARWFGTSKLAAGLGGAAVVILLAVGAGVAISIARHFSPDSGATPAPSSATAGPVSGGPNITDTINPTFRLPIGGPEPGSIASASFISAGRGWVVARRRVMQTANGGETWEDMSTLKVAARRIQFASRSDGWAVADGLLATNDAGRTWRDVTVPGERQIGPFDFLDASRGWLERAGELYRTVDAGSSWNSTPNPCDAPHTITALDFASESTGWVACSQPSGVAPLWQTHDGGLTWEPGPSELPAPGHVWSLQFLDDGHGWVSITLAGLHGVEAGGLYASTDGGSTWSQVLDATAVVLPAVTFVDPNTAHATDDGDLFLTPDGGVTWTAVQPGPSPLGAPDFVDAERGYGVGSSFLGPTFVKTTDGGKSWVEVPSNVPAAAEVLDFADESNAWLLSGNIGPNAMQALFSTTDGGVSWSPVQVPGLSDDTAVSGIARVNRDLGFAALNDGTLLRTDDGGATFEQVATPSAAWRRISFGTPKDGWRVTYEQAPKDTLEVTSDGGETWTAVAVFPYIKHFVLLPNGVGWLAAGNASEALFRTKDGGRTWTAFHIQNQYAATVSAVAGDHAWITDGGTRLMRTVDGGYGWAVLSQ